MLNVSDSSRWTVAGGVMGQPAPEIERLPILIGDHVFIGTGVIILGGCVIGDRARIGAGVVLPKHTVIPPDATVRLVTPVFGLKARAPFDLVMPFDRRKH